MLRTRNVFQNDKDKFRRVIKRVTGSFYQKRVGKVSKWEEIFDILMWQTSKGAFRTPPLRNPLAPHDHHAQILEEKRIAFSRNLLYNQSQAKNILLDTPSISKQLLPFPKLTITETSWAFPRSWKHDTSERRNILCIAATCMAIYF